MEGFCHRGINICYKEWKMESVGHKEGSQQLHSERDERVVCYKEVSCVFQGEEGYGRCLL